MQRVNGLWFAAFLLTCFALGCDPVHESEKVVVFDHGKRIAVGVPGTKTHHKLEFRNPWRQPINIENVSASCTCTDVSVVSRSIGQNDTIELLFDYRISDNDSAQDLQFAIDFSDGRIAVNKLKMVSYREIVVEGESSLSLGSLKAGKKYTFRHEIALRGPYPHRIINAKSNGQHIDILKFESPFQTRSKPIDETRYNLMFTLDVPSNNVEFGRQTEAIAVNYSIGETDRTTEFEVRWNCLNEFYSNPKRLFFDESNRVRSFTIERTDQKPFVISAVEGNGIELKTSIVGLGRAAKHELMVETQSYNQDSFFVVSVLTDIGRHDVPSCFFTSSSKEN